MTFTNLKQFLRVLVALTIVFGSTAESSAAMCSAELVQCYGDAATLGDWFARTAAGLDCEVTYAGCVREALLGI